MHCDSGAITATDFACGALVVGVVVVAVAVVAARTVVSRSVVLRFDDNEVYWHNNCHNDQCDGSSSESPDERLLVERLGPPGCKIALFGEFLLDGKKGGRVGWRVISEVRVARGR